jgi:Animal haem peroxidase
LYDWKETQPRGTRLLLAGEDLQRNDQERALIGDPRNDENVILTQLHLLFVRFHNAVVDRLVAEGNVAEDDVFDEAQRLVRWHYQWMVLHEFLPLVAGETAVERALAGREHFRWEDEDEAEPFIPFEFSVAAFRFGHSMVRSDYVMQRRARRGTPLFPNLGGFRALDAHLLIDWELFFDLPDADGVRPQSSQLINTTIARPLWSLPETGKALPRLTLERGRKIGLPSGQEVAQAMGERPLSADDLPLATVAEDARTALSQATPLWFYILCEAEKEGAEGARLGPVGGRIVAEVLVGLLEGDPTSYRSAMPDWKPTELGTGGSFAMADLIAIAQGRPKP